MAHAGNCGLVSDYSAQSASVGTRNPRGRGPKQKPAWEVRRITLSLTEGEARTVDALREKLGIHAQNEVFRVALRELAIRHGCVRQGAGR